MRRTFLAAGLLLAGCTPFDGIARAASQHPGPSFDGAFWKHWGDGQAEVAAYDLTIPRYGEPRTGVAVAIFVTETLSQGKRVKLDFPSKGADALPVMKLNLVYDFQTGIYDYNVITSAFVGLRQHAGGAAGTPTKVSFSAQEWCGHVYHHLLFDSGSVRNQLHSYFESEGDQHGELPFPAGGMSADTLLLWARGLAGPVLKPGETVDVPLLPRLIDARFRHQPLQWTTARLSRAAAVVEVDVANGTFTADELSATIATGTVWTFWVESQAPRRLLRWRSSDGEAGQLVSAKRLKYWELHREGREQLLSELGLARRAARMP